MPALYRNPRLATARPSWLLVALVAMMALATFAWTQTATAAPVTRYVATDGNDDGGANDCTNQAAPCATIAHALTQAVSGDTVEIAAGTYTEGNLLIDKDLTVQGAGEDLATGTVIQANAVAESGADVRVMSISSGAVVVSGVYVRHGDSTGDGGAIQVLAGATVTLADSTLANNRANDGGAIYSAGALTLSNVDVRDNESLQTGGGIESLGTLTILDGSSVNDNVAGHHGGGIRATNPVTITDSTVHGNQGDQGGGLWLTGGAATPFVITDSLIAYNQGTTGAGIYRSQGALSITGSTVASNTATVDGGGIASINAGSLSITNSTIGGPDLSDGNTAEDDGAGVFATGGTSLTISGSTIANNRTSTDGAGSYGGGVYSDIPTTITDSTVAANSAQHGGGGLYQDISTLNVTNSVIAGNTTSAVGSGGGVKGAGTANVTVSHSAITNNDSNHGGAISIGDGALSITYSAIAGNTTSNGLFPVKDGLDSELASTVSAQYNWWGSADGPSHDDDNPGGSGDGVSAYLDPEDYTPWLAGVGLTPAGGNVQAGVSLNLTASLLDNTAQPVANSGLAFRFTRTGVSPGDEDVAIEADGANALSFTPALGVTNATVAVLFGGAPATGVTLATTEAYTGGAGAPDTLAFTTQPGGASTADPLTSQPVLRVTDDVGNVVDIDTGIVTASIASGPSGASLLGDTTADLADGAATFTDLGLDVPGSYQLRFTVSGTGGAADGLVEDSTPFAITGGPLGGAIAAPGDTDAAQTTDITFQFTTTSKVPQGGSIVVTFPAGFDLTQVTGVDHGQSLNLPNDLDASVDGQVVTLTSESGGALIPAGVLARFRLQSVVLPDPTGVTGTFSIETRHASNDVIDTGTAAGFNVTVGPTDANNSTMDASPTSVLANGQSSSTITVTLRDAGGNPVVGEEVELSMVEPGSLLVDPVSPTSDAAGEAVFGVSLSTPGVATIRAEASDAGVFLVDTAPVTFTAVTPHAGNSTTTVDQPTRVADGASTATITVTVEDADGVAMAGETVTLGQGGGSSVIAGSGTTNASGVTTFTVTNVNAEAVTYTPSVLGVDLDPVTVTFTPGPVEAGSSTLSRTPGGSINTNSNVTLTVTLRDQQGNPIGTSDPGTAVAIYAGDPAVDGVLFTGSAGTSTNGTFSVAYTQSTVGSVTFHAFLGADSTGTAIGTASVDFVAPPPPPPSGGQPSATPTPTGPVRTINQVETAIEAGQPAEVETEAPDGTSLKVTAPANALPAGATLTASAVADIEELIAIAPPPEDAAVVLSFVVEASDGNGEAITDGFNEPVTLEFTIPASAVPDGATAGELVLVFWNGSEWVEVEATFTMHPDGSVSVTAFVDHFTIFAILHQPGRGTFSVPPTAGVTLTTWRGGGYALLEDALEPGASVWTFVGGEPVGYVVGAPDFVNAPFLALFPSGVPAGTPLAAAME